MTFAFLDDHEPSRTLETAKARRAELRVYLKMSGLRPLTSVEILRCLYLVDLTSRIPRKYRAAPVARTPTPEMERAARRMLALNVPAHVIEQETGITRNKLSRWLGARP